MPITTTINVSLECDECGEEQDSYFTSSEIDTMMSVDAVEEEARTDHDWGFDPRSMMPRTLCESCLADAEEAEATSSVTA